MCGRRSGYEYAADWPADAECATAVEVLFLSSIGAPSRATQTSVPFCSQSS